jgi:hypothetical protein
MSKQSKHSRAVQKHLHQDSLFVSSIEFIYSLRNQRAKSKAHKRQQVTLILASRRLNIGAFFNISGMIMNLPGTRQNVPQL